MKHLFLALALTLFALPACGQTFLNKTAGVVWDHTDFATALNYEVGYFLQTVKPDRTCDTLAAPAASPALTVTVPKPATTTGVGMTGSLTSNPAGCFVVRMRAIDVSGLASDWSEQTDPLARKPLVPSKPVIK
jgi:hypothetical protein